MDGFQVFMIFFLVIMILWPAIKDKIPQITIGN